MSKCKCCDSSMMKKIEKDLGIKIYSIKYYSPKCGTAIESKKNTLKGIGFYKWVKSLGRK